MGEKGFSFAELMVVLAIVAILAALAVPNMIGSRPKAQLNRVGRGLVSDLQLARIKAMRDNSAWAVIFVSSGYDVASDYGADEDWGSSDDTIYKSVRLSSYPGVRYGSLYGARPGASSDPDDGVSFSGNTAVFNPDGTASSGTVYFSNDTETIAVGVASAAGRIKLWKNRGSGWSD